MCVRHQIHEQYLLSTLMQDCSVSLSLLGKTIMRSCDRRSSRDTYLRLFLPLSYTPPRPSGTETGTFLAPPSPPPCAWECHCKQKKGNFRFVFGCLGISTSEWVPKVYRQLERGRGGMEEGHELGWKRWHPFFFSKSSVGWEMRWNGARSTNWAGGFDICTSSPTWRVVSGGRGGKVSFNEETAQVA